MNCPNQHCQLLGTVDVRELRSLRWGPIRQLFPTSVGT
jgi:hypothetical protein